MSKAALDQGPGISIRELLLQDGSWYLRDTCACRRTPKIFQITWVKEALLVVEDGNMAIGCGPVLFSSGVTADMVKS